VAKEVLNKFLKRTRVLQKSLLHAILMCFHVSSKTLIMR